MLTHAYLNRLIRALFESTNAIDLGTGPTTKMTGLGYSGPFAVSAFGVAFSGDATSGPHSASNSGPSAMSVYFGEATGEWPEISHMLVTVPGNLWSGSPIFSGELNGGTPVAITSGQEIKIAPYQASPAKGFTVTVSAS